MKNFSRSLKMVGVITLFFFTWSYLPLFQFVAYAATQDKQATKAQTQKAEKHQPSEKLKKLLDDLKANTNRAEEKAAKGQDTSSEVESIKVRKADFDAIDTDLKKEFALTEQKLKSANLPKEIISRHYKFVQNYETNFAELKANLDAIEKAKTPAALAPELAKTEKQLSKIKPPKKRKPFDPNKLPNKARLVKHAAQEQKKPEENKIPPMQPLRKRAGLNPFNEQNTAQTRRPILVASNGPLDGLISTSQTDDLSSHQQLADLTTDSVIMNSIIGYPTIITHPPASAADLAETPEIQFTPAILAKAQELEHKPVKIWEWVKNNIEFVPTYGSIQGADMCLQTMQCNDIDTASLLIALLRASNISARYVYGTLELPIEKAKNWLGGATDAATVGTILATNGIPGKLLISGGTITAVQFEHVWVNAWINYIPSRGAVHRFGHEDSWIPLDASYNQYNYTPGIDIAAAVPFDAQTFANQIQSTATINQTDGSVTNVNSSLIQQSMQDYQTQVQNYIQQNYPNATVGDVIGKKEIRQQHFPFFPGTLQYITLPGSSEFAQVPDNLRETISFSIPDPSGASAGLTYTTGMPQIAGKKITLSFSPATATDLAVIDSYLPKPHADGTPIQPSELPSSLPAYLINLKPELRIDGQVVATGSAITMGAELSFTISLNEPGIGPSQINNVVLAGEYYGIGLDTGRMANLGALKAKLESTKTKLETQNYADMTKEEIVGDLLYTTAAAYFAELDVNDEIAARLMNVVRYRAPSIGMFSLKLDVRGIFNIPTSAGSKGMMMDVDRAMQAVFGKDGSMDKVKHYMLASGYMSSALENAVPEQLYSTPDMPAQGLSAVKALKIANDQNIPIYKITQGNIATIMPQLQLDADTKSDIANAVNAGKEVTVSKSNITFGTWVGCGYIISDPTTGAGAYMISGGANGAILQTLLQLLKGLFFLVGLGASLMGASFLAAFILPTLLALFVSWMSSQIFHDFSWPLEISGLLTGLGLDIFTGILINQFFGASLFLPLAVTPIGFIVIACLVVFTVVALTMLYVMYWPERRLYFALGGYDEKRIFN